ncbi:MAG: tetratricopeptide repeat protein [Planctomycetota bacterium JB042]
MRGARVRRAAIGAAALVVALVGCASPDGGAYRTPSEESRNTVEAQRLNRLAADRLEGDDLDAAERLLAEAIGEDLWYGPAHNNLGVVHLKRGDLYEAAHEFEAARKLMPGHPDPRMNLGIALERAARVDEAIAAYAAALEVYSDHLPAMQAMARLQVSAGRVDERTEGLLREIAMRGDATWRDWAIRHAPAEP